MKSGVFLRQIRAYAQLSLRKRVSYVDAVRVMAEARWKTIVQETSDPAELQRQKDRLVGEVLSNYSALDVFFRPDMDEAESWFSIPE